jgi:Tfp pilus assembly protein PilZ
MGIQFIDLSDEQRSIIHGMVDDLLIQQLLARRRFAYLDARLSVDFVHAKVHHELVSSRLSAEGLFLPTDELVPAGTRLHLEIAIPERKEKLRVLGEVDTVIDSPEPGEPTGLEIRFVDLGKSGQRAIHELMESRLAGTISIDETERRSHGRLQRTAKIGFKTAGWYGTALAGDLSVGGVFIQTPHLAPVGTGLSVTLFHPVRLRHLTLQGTIVRRVPPDPGRPDLVPGVAVSFEDVKDEDQDELREFLRDFAFEPNLCRA